MADAELWGLPTANLALGASLLSLFSSTVIGVIVVRRDRADIRVRGTVGTVHFGRKSVGPLFSFEAANRGRRPVTLTAYCLEYSDRSSGYCAPYPFAPLPKKLEEGESYTGFMSLRAVQQAVREKKARLTAIYFNTADGRRHRQRLWPWSQTYKLLAKQPLSPEAKNLDLLDPTAPLRDMFG